MISHKNKSGSANKHIWIIPVVILAIITLSGGAYYAFNRYQSIQAERLLIQDEKARTQASELAKTQASELAEYQKKVAAVNRETFYDGIYINGQSIGGLTREAVNADLDAFEKQIRDSFNVQISLGEQKMTITSEQAGMVFDSDEIVAQAYDAARKSSAATEREQVLERFAALEKLKQNPLRLSVETKVDTEKVRQMIIDWAATLNIDAQNAVATGFDLGSRTFKIKEAVTGLKVDPTVTAESVVSQLAAGTYRINATMQGEPIAPTINADSMRSKLGHISTSKTLAGSGSGASRDQNISLIVKGLNGYVLQPGETFSFNGHFGKRTAEKGFKEAGGIVDGILVQELGGGICQPNTTLFQSVLKADLEIVERRPHSWPSAYTSVGLDATVSWPGPDFKFKNNTDYPIAIVASFKKPDIIVQIYGRLLAPGVSISLVAEHNGYIDVAAPIERVNKELEPGTRVEIREGRKGQRATAYKVWKKDDKVIKREIAVTSYYRPIQGIFEYNPDLPIPTPTETTATTKATTAATTPATTAAATTAPGATTASGTTTP